MTWTRTDDLCGETWESTLRDLAIADACPRDPGHPSGIVHTWNDGVVSNTCSIAHFHHYNLPAILLSATTISDCYISFPRLVLRL